VVKGMISKISKVIKELPTLAKMTKGKPINLEFDAKQIKGLADGLDEKFGKVVQSTLKEMENPTLEVACKAKSNYAIAGLKFKDGEKVVSTGAISITNPGCNQAVVKYKLNGFDSNANGFIDGGKALDINDMSTSIARKKGRLKADVEIGKGTAHHLDVGENTVKYVAEKSGHGDKLANVAQKLNNFQRTADAMMVDVRKILRGDVQSSKTVAKHLDPEIMQKFANNVTKESLDGAFKRVPIIPEGKKLSLEGIEKILQEVAPKHKS
jgi:hypothetical protein